MILDTKPWGLDRRGGVTVPWELKRVSVIADRIEIPQKYIAENVTDGRQNADPPSDGSMEIK